MSKTSDRIDAAIKKHKDGLKENEETRKAISNIVKSPRKGLSLKKAKTIEYEENQIKIQEFYDEFLKENDRLPSKKEMAQGTGLSRPTIDNHIESISLDTFTHKHKIKMDKILTALEKKAETGDTQAIKLYLQVVAQWVEKFEKKSDNTETKVLRVEFVDDKTKQIEMESTEYEEIEEEKQEVI